MTNKDSDNASAPPPPPPPPQYDPDLRDWVRKNDDRDYATKDSITRKLPDDK